jgi:hypothetical protein
MTTTSVRHKSLFLTLLNAAIAGLTSTTLTLPNSLLILGLATSKAEIIAKLKTYSQLFTASLAAKQAYLASVATRKAAEPEMHAFYAAFVIALKQALGPNLAGQLAGFGILPPRERKSVSPEAKAIAKVKAAATRLARGTMGKVQRQKIKAMPDLTLQVLGVDGKPVSVGTPGPEGSAPKP